MEFRRHESAICDQQRAGDHEREQRRQYNVRVANALGSVKSANATLKVGVPPTILVQPTNEAVAGGSRGYTKCRS